MTMQSLIEERLGGLEPLHLEVVNESGNHNVPKGSESHFKVTIVSKRFETMSRVERHRAINSLLKQEMAASIHALAIHAYTEADWEQRFGKAPMSPPCMHRKTPELPAS